MRPLLVSLCIFAVICCGALAQQAAAQPPAVGGSQADADAIRARLQDLERQIEELKKSLGAAAAEPAEEEPFREEPGYEAPPEPRPAERVQLELPDISVIGDIRGNWTNDRGDPNRDKVRLYHAELALQSYLYPDIRGDVIVGVARHDEDFDVHVEEGFINFLDMGRGFGLLAGRKFIPFGKANQLHTHHRLYSDTPTVLSSFFGERLVGDGAVLSYLAPTRTFLRLELGSWYAAAHSHDAHEEQGGDEAEAHPLGLLGTVNTGRLWTSRPLTDTSELELGATYAAASGARACGLDLTYKHWPTAYRRLTLQAEYLRGTNHRTDQRIDGLYLLANQRLDKYWDVGLRYDWAEFVQPATSHGSGVVGIVTRHLTETTYLRLQYKHAHLPGAGTLHEPMVVINFGMGPHAHPLE